MSPLLEEESKKVPEPSALIGLLLLGISRLKRQK
ncbi:MAG: PEP-CTERM sorting domain-containing protein [Okeania sp. SIO2H7]|nr:PEP-CTERM sorting domain-containing protein [Okeania sp. SIO2H7]